MSIRKPAEVFPPGEFIKEEIEARGWTQVDLAEILGRPLPTVNEIINGKKAITPETATDLAAAFGTSPEYWLNLEQSYRLWRVSNVPKDDITRRARLFSYAPVVDMVKRGWIERSDNVEVLEERVKTFFGVPSLEVEPKPFSLAARKSTSYTGKSTPAQMAWFFRAKQLSPAVHAVKFSQENLAPLVERLKLLMQAPQEVRHVPRVLAEAGIRFIVIQPLPGTKIDGACLWPDGESPVIAMALRFDRIDNFWFTLLHEVRHCAQGVASIDTLEDGATDEDEKPLIERDADDFAVKSLVDQGALTNFILRKRPLYSTRSIEAFAYTQHVHPGIVVGQLQKRGEVKYENFRKLLVQVRKTVTDSAITDGWGKAVPGFD